MKCDYCGETFRLRESPSRQMRAFYAIFMCPHCLSILRPGNTQVRLLTTFTISLLAALVTVFVEFGTPLLNVAVPAALFTTAFGVWVASLFCKETVLLAIWDPDEDLDLLEPGLNAAENASTTEES